MKEKIEIILVEDEPAILRGLAAVIRQLSDNFEITETAHNGIDALEKIRRLQPDIVITDIQMPLLDGLGLIESASSECPYTLFVILSGFAEFEYAKRAVRLHVADYLLKPVDPDLLYELLMRLKDQIHARQEKEISSYLLTEFDNTSSICDFDLLNGYTVYLIFTFYGSVISSKYNELSTFDLPDKSERISLSKKIEDAFPIQVYPLRHHYRNECVYALIVKSDMNDNSSVIRNAAATIHEDLLSDKIFVNSILSRPLPDGRDIPSCVRDCYLYTASLVCFGKSMFITLPDSSDENNTLSISPAASKLLSGIRPAMDPATISSMVSTLTDFWENTSSPQLQIQIDLRNIFARVSHFSNNTFSVDVLEILALSSSYTELNASIVSALTKLCSCQGNISEKIPHSQALAQKVRDYLDKNYTSTIIYKDFSELFGYHEKYITAIFKEEYGVSPSKYVLELRMTAARNIMRENPDILLKDVAESVGYDDPLYFSRVFKNNEGISPKSYQKSLLDT